MNANVISREKSSNGRYRVLIRCLYCGKERWVKESIVSKGNGKFCCPHCSNAYRKEHNNEYNKPKVVANKCINCGISLCNDHHGLYSICYTMYHEGSNMCYTCHIKQLIRERQEVEALILTEEFKSTGLKTLNIRMQIDILNRLWNYQIDFQKKYLDSGPDGQLI